MSEVKEMCGDNRFEVIKKAKEDLIESTNIETSPEEMAVIDNILYRAWQMGWLSKYEQDAPDTNVGDKWVSVDERLPNVDTNKSGCEQKMVIASNGKLSRAMIYERACVRGKKVYRWKWAWGRIYVGNDITHWMPLPEPPKEVQ